MAPSQPAAPAIADCARHAAGPGLPTGIAAAAALVVVLLVAVVTGYGIAAARAGRERRAMEVC